MYCKYVVCLEFYSFNPMYIIFWACFHSVSQRFCIVEFDESLGKTVDVVPKCWVLNDHCWWPPYKAPAKMMNAEEPNENWALVCCRVLGTYGCYTLNFQFFSMYVINQCSGNSQSSVLAGFKHGEDSWISKNGVLMHKKTLNNFWGQVTSFQ